MNKVEVVWCIGPVFFHILNLESAIWRDPERIVNTSSDEGSLSLELYLPRWLNRAQVGAYDFSFWVLTVCKKAELANGLVKDLKTQCTYSAISIAQIPVPVPTSRIFLGFCSGEIYNAPPKSERKI